MDMMPLAAAWRACRPRIRKAPACCGAGFCLGLSQPDYNFARAVGCFQVLGYPHRPIELPEAFWAIRVILVLVKAFWTLGGQSVGRFKNKALFFASLNTTFGQLQANPSSGDALRFAKAQQARTSDAVYAMVQCRNYLSKADYLARYSVAEKQILNCSPSNGAQVIYDGCFHRSTACSHLRVSSQAAVTTRDTTFSYKPYLLFSDS
ncbi:Gnk2-homologous domain [Dillenia turbinata]|uniref:Gnk2-homologous domain n=1 Tax=Dillenia turbinata TaxID=194707 RepID=A0AAN8ZGG9_9MAGN